MTNVVMTTNGGNAQGAAAAKLQTMVALQDTPGPLLPLGKVTSAAAQLHQTGRSCIMQHFQEWSVR